MDVINLDPKAFEYKQVSVPLEECCLIYQWTTAALRTHSRVHKVAIVGSLALVVAVLIGYD